VTVFLAIATYFMQLWAGQKARRYKNEFDPKVYPGKRYIMFPPFY
jgi:very-long-chain enoyl-CoA reductase